MVHAKAQNHRTVENCGLEKELPMYGDWPLSFFFRFVVFRKVRGPEESICVHT